jgi:hypothetical protein
VCFAKANSLQECFAKRGFEFLSVAHFVCGHFF